jgi:hypothetical protein
VKNWMGWALAAIIIYFLYINYKKNTGKGPLCQYGTGCGFVPGGCGGTVGDNPGACKGTTVGGIPERNPPRPLPPVYIRPHCNIAPKPFPVYVCTKTTAPAQCGAKKVNLPPIPVLPPPKPVPLPPVHVTYPVAPIVRNPIFRPATCFCIPIGGGGGIGISCHSTLRGKYYVL